MIAVLGAMPAVAGETYDRIKSIKKVVVGESRTFPGGPEFMSEHGVEVIDLDDPECVELMTRFIAEKPGLWNEDIGK